MLFICLFSGYRSGNHQSGYGYNSASSSQTRGPWAPGFGSPNYSHAPLEYQQRNHYNNHQVQSSRNISNYQSTQQSYHNQRGVCFLIFIAGVLIYS